MSMTRIKKVKQGGLCYESVAKKIVSSIEKKIFLPGHKLPSEKELCREYKVSHLTVRKALSLLAEQKYAVRRRGAGTFVADPALHHNKRLMTDDFIVVIVSSIRLSFLTELIESMELEANRRGRSLILCNSHASFTKEVSFSGRGKTLRTGNMDYISVSDTQEILCGFIGAFHIVCFNHRDCPVIRCGIHKYHF